MKQIAIYTTIVILIIFTFLYFRTDEKAEIINLFENGAKLSSFEGSQHPFEKLSIAKEISKLFAPSFEVWLKSSTGSRKIVADHKKLEEGIIAIRTELAQLAISFSDFNIKISGDTAKVVLTGKAMGRDPGREDYFLENHGIEVELVKEEGDWVISRAENVEAYDY